MSNISYNDIKRGIVLPQAYSKESAEFLGALAGDGYVGCSKNKNYEIKIAGHLREDLEYLNYLKVIVKNIFNIKAPIYLRDKINTAYLRFRSKGIFYFLISSGFKKEKCLINLPSWIWQEYIKYFIRGLFDTDCSLALKLNHGAKKILPFYKNLFKG